MIALLGGSFDPVHLGHVRVAIEARAALRQPEFRLLPAGRPPHREITHASAGQRLDMLRLALDGHPGLAIDTREIERPGPSWMVDTLDSLRSEYPREPLCLVLGQDAANGFDGWRDWRRILGLAHLAVLSRPGEQAGYGASLASELAPRLADSPAALDSALAGCVLPVRVSAVDISATAVRERIATGRSLDGWLAPAVADYIRRHGLYGAAPSL